MIKKLMVFYPTTYYERLSEDHTTYHARAKWGVLYFDIPEGTYIGYSGGRFYGKPGTTITYLGYGDGDASSYIPYVNMDYYIGADGVPHGIGGTDPVNTPLSQFQGSFVQWMNHCIEKAQNQGSDIYNTDIVDVGGRCLTGDTIHFDFIYFPIYRENDNTYVATLSAYGYTSAEDPLWVQSNMEGDRASVLRSTFRADFFVNGFESFYSEHALLEEPFVNDSTQLPLLDITGKLYIVDLDSGDNVYFSKSTAAKEYAATGERNDDPESDTGSGTEPGNDDAESSTDGGDEYHRPAVNIITSNGCNYYKLNSSQIEDLMEFFWTKFTDFQALALNVFTAQYSDLSQNICSLKLIPTGTPVETIIDNSYIQLGKYTSDIEAQKIIQYSEDGVELVAELSKDDIFTFGNFLDYAPYTTGKVYLPMYGIVDVDINKLMTFGNMYIKVACDVCTGQGCYTISYGYSATRCRVDGVYETQFGIDVTLGLMDTLDSQKKQIEAMAKTGVGLASSVPTGGAGLMMAGSSLACDISDPVKVIGSNTGSEKIFLPWKCCLILEKNEGDVAKDTYKNAVGYPCNRSHLIGTTITSGYIKTVNANYTYFTGTQTEYEEMVNLLNGGVYI